MIYPFTVLRYRTLGSSISGIFDVVPDIQNLNFDIEYIFHRYRNNQLQYRITSISEPDIEGSTFDIEVFFDIEGF